MQSFCNNYTGEYAGKIRSYIHTKHGVNVVKQLNLHHDFLIVTICVPLLRQVVLSVMLLLTWGNEQCSIASTGIDYATVLSYRDSINHPLYLKAPYQ